MSIAREYYRSLDTQIIRNFRVSCFTLKQGCFLVKLFTLTYISEHNIFIYLVYFCFSLQLSPGSKLSRWFELQPDSDALPLFRPESGFVDYPLDDYQSTDSLLQKNKPKRRSNLSLKLRRVTTFWQLSSRFDLDV